MYMYVYIYMLGMLYVLRSRNYEQHFLDPNCFHIWDERAKVFNSYFPQFWTWILEKVDAISVSAYKLDLL